MESNKEQLQRAKEYFRKELLSTFAYENPSDHCEAVRDGYELRYSSRLYSFQRSAYIVLNYPDSSDYDAYCRELVSNVIKALETSDE